MKWEEEDTVITAPFPKPWLPEMVYNVSTFIPVKSKSEFFKTSDVGASYDFTHMRGGP
jgi:hypothetical protein